jgi:hypothetical protein
LTVGLAIAVLGAATPSAVSSPRDAITAADAIPAYEVLTAVRSMGLNPSTQAVRRGPYYVLHAIDPRGVEVRVIADAQFGDILSVAPVRAYEDAPPYQNGPRIIEIPPAGDGDLAGEAPEPPAARAKPRPKRHSAAPQAGGPSPIYPTPKFGGTADDGEKFGPPEGH